jgi:hypothetical protein
METFDSFEKAVGTGIGQFVEINASQTQAIVKVDAATYFQIANCCKARNWCLGLRMNRTELAEDVNTFEITVDLALKQSFVLRPPIHYMEFLSISTGQLIPKSSACELHVCMMRSPPSGAAMNQPLLLKVKVRMKMICYARSYICGQLMFSECTRRHKKATKMIPARMKVRKRRR